MPNPNASFQSAGSTHAVARPALLHDRAQVRVRVLVQALAQARVSKGINKLALKKVLVVSTQLKPGETFSQPVAVGKQPIKGKDALFTPLVKDITKRILKPKDGQSASDKIDLRNLGETIAVDVGDEVMRRTLRKEPYECFFSNDPEMAMRIVAGSARSMGVRVED